VIEKEDLGVEMGKEEVGGRIRRRDFVWFNGGLGTVQSQRNEIRSSDSVHRVYNRMCALD
jgi:hypothetical protein